MVVSKTELCPTFPSILPSCNWSFINWLFFSSSQLDQGERNVVDNPICASRHIHKTHEPSQHTNTQRSPMQPQSIYLTQMSGFLLLSSRNVTSISPTCMVARAGTSLVPITTPISCVNTYSLKSNTLFFKTYFKQVQQKFFMWVFLKSFQERHNCLFMGYVCIQALNIQSYKVDMWLDF